MKRITLGFFVALATVGTALAASGHSASADRLQKADQKLAARSATTSNGAAQSRLRSQRARVQSLIADIEAGKSVDPSAVDRALQAAEQP